jgi:hypothetical protein
MMRREDTKMDKTKNYHIINPLERLSKIFTLYNLGCLVCVTLEKYTRFIIIRMGK